jgi:L-lactate dehydrogenase complex protein LldF
MPPLFKERIRQALANPGLQEALDANAERRRKARQQAYASLPEDLQTLRRRAHEVRRRAIADLEPLLEQFVRKASTNGFTIHRAATAAEAVGIVLEIARQNGARLVAKSKTMVSEEIGLNHALEAAGLRAVETDLGEFIVQLRNEPPAHIITPAVHLRRADVGRTFHEQLGLPLTDDIPTMTAAARRVLRQVFFDADIGLSGVNFGVVETGSLCLVTNEGNGRMVTTVPPVHVALMGLERLVPTLDDLALLLYLLPRSATGQKLSVYTSLIHGPRRPGDPDGPLQRHLILVDNGRLALRNSPLEEALYCIRCGACLNACPVFREIGGHGYVGKHGQGSSYPGPIGSVISPGLFGQGEFGQLARASSLCGACKEACPVDIDLPKLLLRVRAGLNPAYELPVWPSQGQAKAAPTRLVESSNLKPMANTPGPLAWGLRVYTWFAMDARRFALAQRLSAIFGRLAAPSKPWLRLPAFTGWGYSKDMVRPAAKSFHQRYRERQNIIGPQVHSIHVIPQGKAASEKGPVALPDQEQTAGKPIDLAERFANELEALGGQVWRCDPAGLAQAIAGLASARGVSEILAWEADRLPEGLAAQLGEAGLRLVHSDGSFDQNARLVQLKIGLTGALGAVAETGSLALASGPGQAQAAAILPETHIAVLEEKDIRASLAELLTRPEISASAAAVLITGPSRTADIEMTLTIGVHGPRELIVLLI